MNRTFYHVSGCSLLYFSLICWHPGRGPTNERVVDETLQRQLRPTLMDLIEGLGLNQLTQTEKALQVKYCTGHSEPTSM